MGCCQLSNLMPVETALNQMLAQAKPVTETETVYLLDALHRILANDVISPLTLPAWDNSAMDGYALRVNDLSGSGPWRLPVSLRIAAGESIHTLPAISCARIFTGAPVPINADTIVMQEDCEASNGWMTFKQKPTIGSNIRRTGEDLKTGDRVLIKGTRLNPTDISLLAGLGIARIEVKRRVRVALIATGDELVEPGTLLDIGKVYNSNRYLLRALLTSMNIEIIDGGIVSDSLIETENALRDASQKADCIITTGGVSVGDEDHVKNAVSNVGSIDLWKLSIKPGKPLAFGHVQQTPIIGLPGNPAAVLVTFCAVARAFLLTLAGASSVNYKSVLIPAGFARRANKRQEFLRVKINYLPNGTQVLAEHPNQGSHLLSSSTWADGLAITQIDQVIKAGDVLPFISFSELFN